MLRSEKERQIGELRDLFGRMTSAVFLDFTGMNVDQVTELRNSFRAKGVIYRVVKNTLVRQALGEDSGSKLQSVLTGMTGVAWSFDEPSAAARVVKDYAKKNEKLRVKGGLMDGLIFDAKAVENQLATLPSKDEARAHLLATFMAPAQHFVRLLNAPAQNFVGVMAAKQRKEEG